jgi:NAD(P)-dependent dehydrogenase (short-subunit alcohol dehydrogenase family)
VGKDVAMTKTKGPKVALIVGAGDHLGSAIAKRFAKLWSMGVRPRQHIDIPRDQAPKKSGSHSYRLIFRGEIVDMAPLVFQFKTDCIT